MSDEQETAATTGENLGAADAAAVTVEAAQQPAQPAQPAPAGEHVGETFVLGQNLDHNRVFYQEGGTVSGSVFTAADFATLRAAGILRYPHEVAKAEDVAARMRAQEAAMAEMQAQIEQLRRERDEAKDGTKRGASGSKTR